MAGNLAGYLCEQYRLVHYGDPWYGKSITNLVKGIPFHLCNRHIVPSTATLAQLIQHIITWREFVIRKLKDDTEYDLVLNSEEDWRKDFLVATDAEWQELTEQLDTSFEQMMEVLSEKSDDWIVEPVEGKLYCKEHIVSGVIHHDVYHLGQIAFLYKVLIA